MRVQYQPTSRTGRAWYKDVLGRQAGRRACVLQRTRTLLGVYKSTRPRYNGPSIHDPSTINRATHGARTQLRAVLTCMCHVVDQPRRAYVRILYTRWSRSLLLYLSLYYYLLLLLWARRAAACSFTCADRSRSSAGMKQKTNVLCRDI